MQKTESVQKKINYLKRDIQYLIDKKKRNHVTANAADLEHEKEQKMIELASLTEMLSRDFTVPSALSESAPGSGGKRGTTRRNAKDDYTHFLEYSRFEPEDMPGYLFFHQSILEKYGVCPHVKIDTSTGQALNKKNIQALREKWLSQTIDKGQSLYDLRDKIVNGADIANLCKERDAQIANIEMSIADYFSEEQYGKWKDCCAFIKEYHSSTLKPKKNRDKFNHVINDLSVLFSQTSLPVHEYLSVIYKNLMFVVNTINVEDKVQIHPDLFKKFKNDIDTLKSTLEKIETQKKHNTSVIQNLNNEFYLYFSNKKSFSEYIKHTFVQTGKYFKKWSALSNEERLERLDSYADYFVESYMISSNIIHTDQKTQILEQLVGILREGYRNKTLTFRYLKWDVKYGIITSIDILKYNKDSGRFYLLNTKPAAAVTPTAKAMATAIATTTPTTTVIQSKRKSSTKNYITSTNEAKVNEIILTFVIKNMKDIASKKLSKDDCLEEIKQKLYLKKLSPEDKSQIFLRYDQIANTVGTI
jgi:hypothetical protein